jgi:nucleotide-binding universal stress UspA family protein
MNTLKGFKRIVLATDGSQQARAAIDATIALGRPASAEVQVVHVWNLEVQQRDGRWTVEARSEASRLVGETVDQIQAGGLLAEARVLQANHDHVAAAISDAARSFRADLVVLGSRGLSDWQSIYKHSVSHQVLSSVDCPVLVVRGRPAGGLSGPRKVLLALAGGRDVAPGARAAVAAAKAPGSRVMVVHVAQAIFTSQGAAFIEPDEEIRATMAEAIARIEDSGVKAEGMVAHAGPVARSLAEIAAGWDADLIVVGSSRMGDVGSLLMGSVSHSLLHDTDRPVLIAGRVTS